MSNENLCKKITWLEHEKIEMRKNHRGYLFKIMSSGAIEWKKISYRGYKNK